VAISEAQRALELNRTNANVLLFLPPTSFRKVMPKESLLLQDHAKNLEKKRWFSVAEDQAVRKDGDFESVDPLYSRSSRN